jgi:hypothetical protein
MKGIATNAVDDTSTAACASRGCHGCLPRELLHLTPRCGPAAAGGVSLRTVMAQASGRLAVNSWSTDHHCDTVPSTGLVPAWLCECECPWECE